jgi:hypothetical protein
VRQGNHVINFDNYAHTIAAHTPSTNKGAFNGCYWCGVALRAFTGTQSFPDLSLCHDDDGNLIPAMPPSLYADDLWHQLVDGMKLCDAGGSRYLRIADVTKMKVTTCPPKPLLKDLDDMDLSENAAALLKDLLSGGSLDGLKEVFPADILDHNVGSNKGLMNIVRKLACDEGIHDSSATRYSIYLTDVNIYHRINKVCVCAETECGLRCCFVHVPFCTPEILLPCIACQ